jgi:hypothetical protein
MGYHKRPILTQGILGEPSKIIEEIEEYIEAEEQGNLILQICELADIYGALESLAQKHRLTMDDLKKMSDCTKSAFGDGTR